MSRMTSKKLQSTALGSALVSALSAMPTLAQEDNAANTAKKDNIEEVLVTGKKDNMLEVRNITAGKMDVSIKDTGRSVLQLDAQQIKDLAIEDVRQAFDYVAGFRGNGPADRTYTARGIRTSIDNVMVDGLRSLQGGEGGTGSRLPSTFNAESTTFLRGPAGLLYGAGVGGGMINITTKKPQEAAKTELGFSNRSYLTDDSSFDANRVNLNLDSTGALTDSVLYRVLAQYTPNGDHFQEGREITEQLLDVALTFKLGENTRITPRFESADRERTGGSGYADGVFEDSVYFGRSDTYGEPLDRTAYYGSPKDKGENTSRSFSINATHKFANDWQLTLRGRDNATESDAQDLYASSSGGLGNEAGSETLQRKWVVAKGEDEYILFDGSLEGKFDTGGVEHHFVLGANYRDMDVKFERNFQDNDSAVGNNTISLRDTSQQTIGPIPAELLEINFSPRNEQDTNIYLKDRISIGAWTVAAGLSYVKQEQEEVRSGETYTGDFSDTIWDLGAIYAISDELNVFATYSRSYDPVSGRYISQYGIPGQTYEPVEGENYELGVKGTFFDGKFSSAVTAFQLSKVNSTQFERVNDVWQMNQLSGDSFRSKGIEWDANLALTPEWNTSISYAYTRAYDTIGDQKGIQESNTPKHSAALWSTYQFTGDLANFRLGGGLRFESERNEIPRSGAILKFDSYVEADAGVYYNSKQFDAALVVRNLLDENRSEAGANWISVQPNDPRSVNFSLQYRL